MTVPIFLALMETTGPRNRLQYEKSPYLLQHASNPVDWYPWGDEALERARREDRPIFLSIGYSTCHWCHVMERESFQDPVVANLMNANFVNIKVDREERPDLDNVYMTVCQMLTGSGGWPLTIVMSPDCRPFFAATYLPRESRFGRVGMLELIPRIARAWRERREELDQSATEIAAALQRATTLPAGQVPSEALLQEAVADLRARFDPLHGGFGRAPKFPAAHNLLFLLRAWRRTADATALQMVTHTLRAMRRGGVYDHIGFGFHRYSTDREWLVPHFEKMLYDQAMLTLAYVEAWQATGEAEFAQTAREIIQYVLRDLTSPEGAFLCAEDADSEGVEGKYYVWTASEVAQVLGTDAAEFCQAYNIRPEGNYCDEATGQRTGANIPHRALDATIALASTEDGLERSRRRLLEHRGTRVRPLRDDKVLADWNGLMIAALAYAGRALGDHSYVAAARRAADFVLARLRDAQGRLLHRYRDGEAAILGTADDHAFMVWGLIELYEASFDTHCLREALSLNAELVARFWDEAAGGFLFAARDAEAVLVRTKETYDGALPAGNSAAALNLLRLARLTGDAKLESLGAQALQALCGQAARAPAGHTFLLCAVDFALGPTTEVVIVGELADPACQALVSAVANEYLPSAVVLHRPPGPAPPIADLSPFVVDMNLVGGAPAAYVCRDFRCQQPVTDPQALRALLAGRGS